MKVLLDDALFHVNSQLPRELSDIFVYMHVNMGSCDGVLLIVAYVLFRAFCILGIDS